jgi:hypothetical protein
MSLTLHEVSWDEWLVDELKSLPYDQRAEILFCAIKHNDLTSLLISRDMSALERFRLASALRDVADILEKQVFGRGDH